MTYYPGLLSAQQERKAMISFLESWTGLDTYITLASNYDAQSDPMSHMLQHRIDHMQRKIYDWEARMCRLLNGRNWQNKPDLRPQGIAFLEHLETNAHWHILLDRKSASQLFSQLHIAAHDVWDRLMPAGNVIVKPIIKLDALPFYNTKEIGKFPSIDSQYILGPRP